MVEKHPRIARGKAVKILPPLALPPTAIDEAAAVKAVYRGDASADLQKRAMDYIIKKLCMIGALSLDHNALLHPKLQDHNEGRRWVGSMITEIIIRDLEYFDTPKK